MLRGSEMPCFFSGEKRQENGTGTEKLRRLQNTTDSSAILLLVRKGPLGMALFPCFRFFYPRFFVNIALFDPPNALAQRKKHG